MFYKLDQVLYGILQNLYHNIVEVYSTTAEIKNWYSFFENGSLITTQTSCQLT